VKAPPIDRLRALLGGSHVRVPVLQADSQVECGGACLAMILSFYGRETTVAETHERCQVGRDGATAQGIAAAARSYGLRVDPYSLEIADLEDVPCPAILYWSFSHFVVLERFTGDRATIVDPGIGRRDISTDELRKRFTGVVLTMAPGEAFSEEAAPTTTRDWWFVTRRAFRARDAKRLMGQIIFASLVLQILSLSVPLLTEVIVDSVLPLQIEDVMAVLAIGILVIVGTQLVLGFLRGLILVNLQAKLDAELMVSFFEHILSLPYRYFQERSTGDLLQRLGSNAQIRNVLSSQTLTSMLDGAFVIFYGFILIVSAPLFGLVAVSLGAVQILLLVVTGRRMNALVYQELAAQGESQGFLVESISGIEALKAAGAEASTLSRWSGIFTEQLEAGMRRGRLSVALVVVTSTMQRLAPLALLWIGAVSVLGGSMSLGRMLALVSLAQLFLGPLGSLVASGLQLQQVGGHLERIAFVLRAEPEQHGDRVRPAPRVKGRIAFEDVSFRYDESAPWAVRNLSLEIAPGQKVAIVGSSGSGKSTIAKLMLGLYEPVEGDVRVDGVSLRELDLRSLRSQCGVVMQEPTVFNGSIRRNIAYNDSTLDDRAITQAARLAALDEEIRAMPMGYDTIVAEGGSALSGGQRQRLAIARALAREPRILVLDEATSNLDSATESRIAEHLAGQNATSLIIAHRLSTVQDADLILVLEQGHVVERGTHRELLAKHGAYAALVSEQLVGPRPDEAA
jgi:ATP-binding cassette subfamily B protein